MRSISAASSSTIGTACCIAAANGEPVSFRHEDGLLKTSLGEIKYQRIKVAPFRIEMFGAVFGFIPQPPEEPGEDWSVIVEPGNYMCFWPPWTSGEYDT